MSRPMIKSLAGKSPCLSSIFRQSRPHCLKLPNFQQFSMLTMWRQPSAIQAYARTAYQCHRQQISDVCKAGGLLVHPFPPEFPVVDNTGVHRYTTQTFKSKTGFRPVAHTAAVSTNVSHNNYPSGHQSYNNTNRKTKPATANLYLYGKFNDTDNIELLLDQVHTRSLTVQDLPQFLSKMNNLLHHQIDLDVLLKDDRFDKVSNTLHSNVRALSPSSLLQCLEALFQMSNKDIYLIESLEKQVQWLLWKMSIGSLIRTLAIHKQHQETPLRKKLLSETLGVTEKRWVELSCPKDLITLMYILDDNSDHLFSKVETRAFDLVEKMDVKELYRVTYLLSRRKHRNTPLIRALIYHLNKSCLKLSNMHLVNLLYACCSLKIYDNHLLNKMSNTLEKKVPHLESNVLLFSILTSFSKLRWHHTPVLDAVFNKIFAIQDHLSPKEISQIVISFSHLVYDNNDMAAILPNFMSRLHTFREHDPMQWLEIVWCLAVLRLCDQETAATVLNAHFLHHLEGLDPFRKTLAQLRLLNVAAAVKHDLISYNGPLIPHDFIDKVHLKALSRSQHGLAVSVTTALSNFAPLNKFVRTDVITPYGYILDAVLFVDKKGEPLVYDEHYGHEPKPGVNQIAFKVLDFPDMTLCTVKPTGLHTMAARHLIHLDYILIQVPYTEFSDRLTTVKKMQYLQRRIRSAIVSS
ncbi:FAST kinase domain-containing protein 4-like [Argonauta hians]